MCRLWRVSKPCLALPRPYARPCRVCARPVCPQRVHTRYGCSPRALPLAPAARVRPCVGACVRPCVRPCAPVRVCACARRRVRARLRVRSGTAYTRGREPCRPRAAVSAQKGGTAGTKKGVCRALCRPFRVGSQTLSPRVTLVTPETGGGVCTGADGGACAGVCEGACAPAPPRRVLALCARARAGGDGRAGRHALARHCAGAHAHNTDACIRCVTRAHASA